MTENQENNAHLYALGALPKKERLHFEEDMRFNDELRSYTIELCEIATDTAIANIKDFSVPPIAVKEQIMERVREIPTEMLRAFDLKEGEGFVMTNNKGQIQWINSDFSEMCGYKLNEVKGKKPGDFLQGEDTDPVEVEKMRRAIREDRPVHVKLTNYHKNGTPYRVSISVSPVLDETRRTRCYVAIEREVPFEREEEVVA